MGPAALAPVTMRSKDGSVTLRETFNGVVDVFTGTQVCTYTFDNGAITLTFPPDGPTFGGSIRGSTLTLIDPEEGIEQVFTK